MFGIIKACVKAATEKVIKTVVNYVEFKLVDDAGKPMPGVTVKVTLPGDKVEEHTSDSDGGILIALSEAGTSKVDLSWDGKTMTQAVLLQ